MLGKLLIIDGSYMLHRSLHIDSIFRMRNSKDQGTGAVMQFLKSMAKEMSNQVDYYPVVCWDAGLAQRRLDVYPNYKSSEDKKRENELIKQGLAQPDPELDKYLREYREQRAQLIEILDTLAIPSLRFNQWEGDDLIKIMSDLSKESVIVTDDRDMIQLLRPNVKVARPIAQQLLDYDSWVAETGDPSMRKYVIAKSIVGDGSDNIPKCAKGVGGKTADLIAEMMIDTNPYDWYQVLGESKKKALKAFVEKESLDQFRVNMELIDLSRVHADDEILRLINNSISCCQKAPNYFGLVSKLMELEITSVDSNTLVAKVVDLQQKGGIYNNA